MITKRIEFTQTIIEKRKSKKVRENARKLGGREREREREREE